jgi:hypothetical protein
MFSHSLLNVISCHVHSQLGSTLFGVLVNRELKNQRTRELPRSSSYALSPFFSLCGCMSVIRSLPALRPSSVSGWFNLVHTTTSQGFHPAPPQVVGRAPDKQTCASTQTRARVEEPGCTGLSSWQRNSRSWRLDGHCKVKRIEHIYPTTKPPILEVGFSEYSDLWKQIWLGEIVFYS